MHGQLDVPSSVGADVVAAQLPIGNAESSSSTQFPHVRSWGPTRHAHTFVSPRSPPPRVAGVHLLCRLAALHAAAGRHAGKCAAAHLLEQRRLDRHDRTGAVAIGCVFPPLRHLSHTHSFSRRVARSCFVAALCSHVTACPNHHRLLPGAFSARTTTPCTLSSPQRRWGLPASQGGPLGRAAAGWS